MAPIANVGMGRNGLRLILIHLLSIRTVQTSIEIPIGIRLLVDLDFPFLFGTSMQQMYAKFSLNTAEISVLDDDCGNAYGKCRSYCQDHSFCHLYCSPICCIAKAWRDKKCETNFEGYHRNSTALKILKDYWRDMDLQRYGVWAEDAIGFRQPDGTFIDAGVQRFALQTVNTFDNIDYPMT
uniref:Alpha-1,6-mannosyl-glycoprotein 6-beta-N-acetylglucosaminyltransferase n=1 Tax=Bursaphelenchus xylophilus TaxID=6326 RepID=A0A1I7SIA3_BURXY